ncbi:GatB/YqeY domain-containing protein [Lapidilactobacillus achengensis]|uniref:GatB/YqeY domain-containing protein n=1 Tax=Lapidilactobacillus achengensis TaxID=2486000 RepID=A0ABW1UM65_9LACO|nr:GatB/YqeY domain-containing protein [Lapidilactobacillus achengensis]
MDLTTQLTNDLKTAMKAHDKTKLNVVRMIKSSLMNAKIKKESLQATLTREEELAVLSTELKQRQDSLAEFEKAGRDDLAAETKAEIAIVQTYLPAPLSDAELGEAVSAAIDETGATSMKDMGAVMKALMPKVKGRADGGKVNQLVKAALTK